MSAFPHTTLADHVLFYPRFRCRKYELDKDVNAYAEQQINEMTNYELLQAISDALEEMQP